MSPTENDLMLTGGEAIVRALADERVAFVFGYPGGAALHIYDAIFKQQRLEHILVRHEQAAVHMADGYARATGLPGVVLVTSGPGATNTITGIATAYMDSIPLVVISAQVPTAQIGTDAFQETDVIGVSRPIVKHSFQAMTAESIPNIIKKAFHIATTGRPGPVLVDIPKDATDPNHTFKYQYPSEINLRSYAPESRLESGLIEHALEILLAARKPVIYVGGGAVQGNASQPLIALADRLHIPVTQTLMGLGAFPGTHPHSLGMLGMHGTYEANMAMHHADVIFAVGARFDDRVTNDPEKFCKSARIIHLDVDPASIGKTIPVEVPLIGDAAKTLTTLNQLLDQRSGAPSVRKKAMDGWWQELQDWRARHGLQHEWLEEERGPIMPQRVINLLYKLTNGGAYIASDVGQHQMFAAQYYHFNAPRQWINSGGLGTMGFGLPAAMGVSFAFPDALSVVVTGEGSIQMNIQELSTCTQYGLPVKIVNLNNQALGMVKQWQDMNYGGRHSHSTYQGSLPDFVRLAESYGHVGIKVSKPSALEAAMRQMLSPELKNKLVFLDVDVDPEEHVYPMAVKGGAMNDMYLSKTERT